MRKAIATFGVGPARELLALALPSFSHYAQRHGYEFVVGDGASHGRAPAWGKVPLLQRLLRDHDFVVWIDADALILDASLDLEPLIPASAFQAYAVTTLMPGRGISPCTGVWAMRANRLAQEFLTAVWQQDDLIHHHQWEQAAVRRLTGWSNDLPYSKTHASTWDSGTFILGEEWDMVPQLPIGYAPGIIRHYAGWSYRRRKFDMRTDLARGRGSYARFWIGQLERHLRPVYRPARALLDRWARKCLATARREARGRLGQNR